MKVLETLITEYLAGIAPGMFMRQYIVIICIFLFGALICDSLCNEKKPALYRTILAFPTGIATFSVTAYAMLAFGVPYNRVTVIAAILTETAVVLVFGRKKTAAFFLRHSYKNMLVALSAVLVTAAFATSGLAPVSVSNDSMYFFRRYPDCIVYYGGLRDQFDFWMTDTGLGIVSVDTLPALFGFAESFGIREFFHINFIAFFATCVYKRAKEHISGTGAVVSTVIITAFLMCATPFVILGHWALANMYFMEMFFIAAYAAFDHYEDSISLIPILLVALAFFRIEGAIFVVWLVLCLSVFKDFGKKLALFVLLPILILFGRYCMRLFMQYNILDDIYLFLTPQKALLILLLIVTCGIWTVFIQKKLPNKISRFIPLLYILVLIAGNGVLFVKDSGLYTGNLKAFYANLFRQSGWGMFPYFVICMTILLIIEFAILHKKKTVSIDRSNLFNIMTVTGFLLIVFAASFGRGDILMEDVTDSGNRVFLQIVPLVVMTYGELFMLLYDVCVRTERN